MTTITEQSLPTGTWTLDKVHSSASFAVKHMVVATFRGGFDEVDAEIRDGVLTGVVQASSIQVRDENLRAHLLSPEFFDVENTPEIRFVSADVRRENGELLVTGDLTIKGHTERVHARGAISEPHTNIGGNPGIGIELQTVIDRTKFGLNWNAPLPKGGFALGNDVTLTVQLELVESAE